MLYKNYVRHKSISFIAGMCFLRTNNLNKLFRNEVY